MSELSDVYGPDAQQGNEHGEADQQYVDRSLLDFDPADGLYSGSAVDGSTDIPGPHQDEAAAEGQEASDTDES